MADSSFFDDIAKFGKAEVKAAIQPVQPQYPEPSPLLNEALNQNSSMVTDNAFLLDRQVLSPVDFYLKYGEEGKAASSKITQSQGLQNAYMMNTPKRTTMEAVGDTGTNIFTGLSGTVGGVAALGAGLVNEDAGVAASSLLKDFQEWNRQDMTEYTKRNEFIEGLRGELDAQDNAKQYEKDKATDGDMKAGFKYVGRGILNATKRVVDNPAALENLVTQGTGSLLGTGPIAKGLNAIGVGIKAAAPASVGLMEGGGAYTGSVDDIMSMTPEELMNTSPDFRARVQAGEDPLSVQKDMANRAGLTAAAIQGPAGAAIGKLTGAAAFEVAPFGIKTLTHAAKDLGKETVEEAFQGATGQGAQNFAKSLEVDPNQSLIEGTGEQIAQGAIGGLGAAGVVQAPSIASGLAKEAAKAGVAPLVYGGKILTKRFDNMMSEAQKSSSSSKETILPAVAQEQARIQDTVQAFVDAAVAEGVDPADAAEYGKSIHDTILNSDQDLGKMPKAVLDKALTDYVDLKRTPNKFETLITATDIINDPEQSNQDREEAALYMQRTINENQTVFLEDYPDFMDKLPKDSPERVAYDALHNYSKAAAEMQEVKQAKEWMDKEMSQTPEQAKDVNFDTEVGAKLVAHTINIAQAAPQALNEDVVQEILNQADETNNLSDTEKAILRNGLSMKQASGILAEKLAAAGLNEAATNTESKADFVARQIATDTAPGSMKLSIRDHIAGINDAIATDDSKAVFDRVLRFTKFAQSQINKSEAFNNSIKSGNATNFHYQAVNQKGQFYKSRNKVGTTISGPNAQKSIGLARTIHAEASVMADMVNEMIDRLGLESKIDKRVVPDLALNKDNTATKSVPEPINKSDVKAEDSTGLNEKDLKEASDETLVKYVKALAKRRTERDLTPREVTIGKQIAAEQLRRIEEADTTTAPEPEVKSEAPAETPKATPEATKSEPVKKAKVKAEKGVSRISDDVIKSSSIGRLQKALAKLNAIAEPNANDLATVTAVTDRIAFLEEEAAKLQEKLDKDKKPVDPEVKQPRILPNLKADEDVIGTDIATPTQNMSLEEILDAPEDVGLEEDAEVKTVDLKVVHPGLFSPGGINHFWNSFFGSKKPNTRIGRFQHPLIFMFRLFNKHPAEVQAFLEGKTTGYKLNNTDRKNIQGLLRKGIQAVDLLEKRLDDNINKSIKGKPSIYANIKNGLLDFLGYNQYRVLSLTEEVNDKLDYNQNLVQAAVMAGLDWVLNNDERHTKATVEDLTKSFDIDEAHAARELATFNEGTPVDRAVESLAKNIRKFWDVSGNREAPAGRVEGIPEAMAKEILTVFDTLGLIQTGIVQTSIPDENTGFGKQFSRIFTDRTTGDTHKIIKGLAPISEVISDYALIDREQEGYSINEPLTDISDSQLRNPLLRLSKMARDAIKHVQATPYYVSQEMFDLVMNMGLEEFVSQRSGYPYKDGDLKKKYQQTPYNRAHWNTVKGKQLTQVTAFNAVQKQMARIQRYAEDNNIPVSEVKVYYRHELISLGRLQMQGAVNPQSDKYAREVFTPTRATIDLSNGNKSKHWIGFMKSIGQGLGLKTEYVAGADMVNNVEALVFDTDGTYFYLVQKAKQWLEARGAEGDEMIQDDFLYLIQKFSGDGLSMHGMSSIIAAARYVIAQENNMDMRFFKTSNYLEADGKTNGASNALMTFSDGPPTVAKYRAMMKTGIFMGRLGMTLAEHYKTDNVDLYGATSSDLIENMSVREEFYKNLKNQEMYEQFKVFKRLLIDLSVDVEIINGNLVIGRNLSKNPLTITIYGSGANGIAGKVASELLDVLYARISENAKNPSQSHFNGYDNVDLHNDLLDMFNKKAVSTRKGKNFVVKEDTSGNALAPAIHFEAKADQFENFRGNVLTFLVQPLVAAIEENVTKHTQDVTKEIQRATNIQSIFLKHMFMHEVGKEIVKAKESGLKANDFLSQKVLDDIMKRLDKFAPTIDTGTQSYMFSGAERANFIHRLDVEIDGVIHTVNSTETYSLTVDKQMKTAAKIRGLTTAGVKAIPVINIGSGDGQMMLNLMSENPDAALRVLHVFDGLNMPVDKIEDYSNKVNQAVHQTWTSNKNPVESVLGAYDKFISSDPFAELKNMNQAAVEDIAAELNKTFQDIYYGEDQPLEVSLEQMAYVGDRLLDHTQSTNALRRLHAEMPSSVDQMASGEAPYITRGTIEVPADASDEQIVDIMRKRYFEILAEEQQKLIDSGSTTGKAPYKTKDRIGPASAVQAPSQELEDEIKSVATENYGVHVLPASGLGSLSPIMNKLGNPVQKALFEAAVYLLKNSGYRIVFGSPELIDVWESANNTDRFVEGSNDHYGKIDPAAKIITISNIAPETIVHELIHAATINKLRARYLRAGKISAEDKEAIDRIESLMQEWLENSEGNDTWSGYEAQEMAKNTIYRHLKNGDKASAVNEFMAWVLSNTKLADRANSMKSKNPLMKIISGVWEGLLGLIFGKEIPSKMDPVSILKALQFNTSILMSTPSIATRSKKVAQAVMLYQSPGSNSRMISIRDRLKKNLVDWVSEDQGNPGDTTISTIKRNSQARKDLIEAKKLAASFSQFFEGLNTSEGYSTFGIIQSAMMSDAALNSNSLLQIEGLYAHVMENLKPSHFRKNNDPNDNNDKDQAEKKYNALNGVYRVVTDSKGRTSLLSSFIALAVVDDEFRDILNTIPKPKTDTVEGHGLDGIIENAGMKSAAAMSSWLAGSKKTDVTSQDVLDNLIESLIDNVEDQQSKIEQSAEGFANFLDNAVATKLQEVSGKVAEASADIVRTSNSRVVKAGASIVNAVSTMINEQKSADAAKGSIEWLNRRGGMQEIRALVNDLVGRTAENKHVVDFVSLVRTTVQQVRQRFREELPKVLNKKFITPPTKEQWTVMFKALGKTDFASIIGRTNITQAMELLTDRTKLLAEIAQVEDAIKTVDLQYHTNIFAKAKQLAEYMNTKKQGYQLLRNATIIAHQIEVNKKLVYRKMASKKLIRDIDYLTSLYAIQGLSQDTINEMKNLISEESDGVNYVASYLVGRRKDELNKIRGNKVALYNHYKGDIPSEQKNGGTVVIRNDSEEPYLLFRGYKKLGDYVGSDADRSSTKKSYYYSPVSANAPFNQGVMQTVHTTVSGIDPETGLTMSGLTAGRITDTNKVDLITKRLPRSANTDENLMPLFDQEGLVYGYEMATDESQLDVLHRNTNLAEMIGAWHGRQIEEIMADEVNNAQIDRLGEEWEKAKRTGKTNQFINIFALKRSDDPILHEAANLLPRQSLDYAEAVFGPDEFWVRRDVALDVFGSRSASVSDMFTGKSRWNRKVTSQFEKIAIGAFGMKAYPGLVSAERNVQEFVSSAKKLIVIRSVVVPLANLTSNMMQLVNRGVPFMEVVIGVPRKAAEINTYIKNMSRIIEIDADIAEAETRNDIVNIRRLKNELKVINDVHTKMTIWPLIEAGEFSAISNGQVTAEDLTIADGKWGNWLESKIKDLPKGYGTVLRYGMITSDTALFKGLARATQYGDFIAKAILYDHSSKNKDADIMDKIAEGNKAFINYNRPMGRNRQYLESIGLLWFYNYKLRIMSEALYTMRNHPLRSLLMMAVPPLPMIGDPGGPVQDNIASIAFQGKLGFSMGIDMGLNSYNLNPWVALSKNF